MQSLVEFNLDKVAADDDTRSIELELLRAVPFHWNGAENELKTNEPELVARLLKLPANMNPLISGALNGLFDDDIVQKRMKAIAALNWDGARYKIEYALKSFDGDLIWIEELGERTRGNNEVATEITGILQDITDSVLDRSAKQENEKYDPETGLLNTPALHDLMAHELSWAPKVQAPKSILITLNNLDDIAKIYGQRTRADGLKYCADLLNEICPDKFKFGILSEGQILGLVPPHLVATAETLGPDLQTRLFAAPIETSAGEISMTGQVEIRPLSELKFPEFDSDQLSAKPILGDSSAIPTRFSKQDILDLLENDRLSLVYQPIIRSDDRDIEYYESLLRITDDDGLMHSAWKLILDAEQLGLVHLLDQRALKIANATLTLYPDVRLALNLSAGTVEHETAHQAYLNYLAEMGEKATRLTIELTETLALKASDLASSFSARARELGCQFAVDDFGAGYTSFRNLLGIEADIIKIDGSFVRDISIKTHQQTFVRLIVDLAQTLGIKTVAEMVDNEADARRLENLGVDYLQGYLFGFPGAILDS